MLRINWKRIIDFFRADVCRIFIVDFILLLMLAAAFLIREDEKKANAVADYAYFVLVIGVLIQLIQHVREKHEKNQQDI